MLLIIFLHMLSLNSFSSEHLTRYVDSISLIKSNIEVMNVEPVNSYPSRDIEYMPAMYDKLSKFVHKVNSEIFSDKDFMPPAMCDFSSFSGKELCLGRDMVKKIENSFSNSKDYFLKFILAHELGHYLQDLHCKLEGSHISIEGCIFPEDTNKGYTPGSVGAKRMSDWHNGTDNYAFAILESFNVFPPKENFERDLYVFMKMTLESDQSRLENAFRALNLDIKVAYESLGLE